jgi:acyl phosphate:glycerol-3-phosphate acyltransferase
MKSWRGYMNIYFFIGLCILSYLFASIPFGLIYSLLRGVDIRKVGSKNIGSTNVSRQFGFLGGFVPVFLLDCMKGALPVLIVRQIGVQNLDVDIAMIITGMICIIGNTFPIYLGFKGGKGVSTSAGVFAVIAPLECAILILIFLIILFLARWIAYSKLKGKEKFFMNMQKGVGMSSLTAAVALPISIFLNEPQRIIIIAISVIIALLIVIRHRDNIVKMIKGA